MSKRNYIPIAVGDLLFDDNDNVYYVLKIERSADLWVHIKYHQNIEKYMMKNIVKLIKEKQWKLQKYDEH